MDKKKEGIPCVSVGIDIGTTTICGIAVDLESGAVLRSDTLPNDSFLKGTPVWEKAQDCGRILEKVRGLLTVYDEAFPQITSIGVTGQMHGILYVDRDGQAASPLYTWQDERGNQRMPEGEGDRTYAQAFQKISECGGATGYGLVTHYYNVKNHLVPASAAKICTIPDYVAMSLCGGKIPVIHASNAASLGGFDLKTGCFAKASLERLGISADILPEVTSGFRILGDYRGIPVSVSIGDNQASFLGSVKGDSTLLINVGTGSQVSMIAGGRKTPEDCEVRPLYEDAHILAGSALCGGRAYAVLAEFFKRCGRDLFGIEPENVYAAMGKLAEEASDQEQLHVATQFCGTRKEPELRGSITNIGLGNFTPGAMVAGVLNGMVDELEAMYQSMKPYAREEARELVGSGNGIRLNEPLQRILEKRFGMKLRIPLHQEEAAFGSVLFSLVACGAYPDIQSAQERLVTYNEV